MNDWRQLAAALADELTAAGKLTTPEWRAALTSVPRHTLVPTFYEQAAGTGHWRTVHSTSDNLQRVYSNTGLYTKLGQGGPWTGHNTPLSSTSTPSLMIRMLETLDIHDNNRVLEIGTGTGYNAALLAHRLGDHNVYSVDIDADLVETARQRLATIGYHPTLAATDGTAGLPEHAPYDRIIATCSVPAIPRAWLEQTTHNGLILADIKRGINAGNLVLLRRTGHQSAEGRFDHRWAGFMALRPANQQPVTPPTREHAATPRASTVGYLRPWDTPILWFLATLNMPPDPTYGHTIGENGQPSDLFIYTPDGSRAELDYTNHTVRENGPHELWHAVEHAHQLWHDTGQPNWDRLGLTITPEQQYIWLDSPNGNHAWPLAT